MSSPDSAEAAHKSQLIGRLRVRASRGILSSTLDLPSAALLSLLWSASPSAFCQHGGRQHGGSVASTGVAKRTRACSPRTKLLLGMLRFSVAFFAAMISVCYIVFGLTYDTTSLRWLGASSFGSTDVKGWVYALFLSPPFAMVSAAAQPAALCERRWSGHRTLRAPRRRRAGRPCDAMARCAALL